MEIGSAYPTVSLLQGVRRNVRMDKETLSIVLKDTYEFESQALRVTERFVSLIEPKLTADGSILVCGINGSAKLVCEGFVGVPRVAMEEFRKPEREIGKA